MAKAAFSKESMSNDMMNIKLIEHRIGILVHWINELD